MLVLSRKQDEFIDIGHNIKVVVVEIQRDKVRLGIDAPRGVTVHRREVTRRIARAEAHARNGTIGLGEEQLDAAENCDAPETPPVHQCERCRYTFTCIYKDNHQAKGDVCSGFNETMRPPENPPIAEAEATPEEAADAVDHLIKCVDCPQHYLPDSDCSELDCPTVREHAAANQGVPQFPSIALASHEAQNRGNPITCYIESEKRCGTAYPNGDFDLWSGPHGPLAAESDTDREVEAIWPIGRPRRTKKPDWEPSAALLNAVDEFSETLWPDAPHWQVKVRDGLLAVCKAMGEPA